MAYFLALNSFVMTYLAQMTTKVRVEGHSQVFSKFLQVGICVTVEVATPLWAAESEVLNLKKSAIRHKVILTQMNSSMQQIVGNKFSSWLLLST